MEIPLHDMHCHLDFMENGEQVAREAAANGSRIFAVTVTPGGWRAARDRFAPFDNVDVGFGMHPWWARECAIEDLLEQDDPIYLGEVGIDLARKHEHTRDLQVDLFARIARWAARRGGRTLSIHSVHAARETLDILEDSGALATCTCIFHWYSGPSDQLKRAKDAGCFFSVNERMLATRKGREYVKAIPADRLLLETDAPPEQGATYSYAELRAELERVAEGIVRIKHAQLPQVAKSRTGK